MDRATVRVARSTDASTDLVPGDIVAHSPDPGTGTGRVQPVTTPLFRLASEPWEQELPRPGLPGRAVRALTLNIQHDAGDPRRLPLLNRELGRVRPDLVALQEVREHQLAALLAGSGLDHTTHQSELIRSPRLGGSVIATRWPHRVVASVERREHGVHWWLLAVSVHVPARGDLLFVTGTTPWEPGAEWARERQARELITLLVRHRTALPPVVAADLNAGPDSPSVRHLAANLRDAWPAAGQGPGHTWTVDNPLAAVEIARLIGDPNHRRRIDYVLTGRQARVLSATLVANHPVDGIWLSDHFGVLAELDLGEAHH